MIDIQITSIRESRAGHLYHFVCPCEKDCSCNEFINKIDYVDNADFPSPIIITCITICTCVPAITNDMSYSMCMVCSVCKYICVYVCVCCVYVCVCEIYIIYVLVPFIIALFMQLCTQMQWVGWIS